ncbi:hypothetical protein H2199_001044 [Coniosporium tulheliwenetii]|uniref:Uncharacterized protein n=1 Tax=Coniosporium tulheliwenetii TaxID=3383036 RepID=A0ACC2ZL48_9PEZI|nr:hypothetical protein H2199_001044 [Cladosporium sp. JES 115]
MPVGEKDNPVRLNYGSQEDQLTIGDLDAQRGKNSRTAHLPNTIDFQLQSILPISRIRVQDRSRYEEVLLVDPDDCGHILFWWPAGDGSGVVRLDVRFLKGRHPIRVILTDDTFACGSNQAEFLDHAAQATALQVEFKVIKHDVCAVEAYESNLQDRSLGRLGVPTNNWWVTRHPDYHSGPQGANRYANFRNGSSEPRLPDWLATGEGRKYHPFFTEDKIEKPLFHSGKMLEDFLQVALLWERKSDRDMYTEQFHSNARFDAAFEKTAHGTCVFIKVWVKNQVIQAGGEWVLPQDGCQAEVTDHQTVFPEMPGRKKIVTWAGKLRRAPSSLGCDLHMVCHIPSVMRRNDIDVPHQFRLRQLQIDILTNDVAIDRQMEAVERAAAFISALDREQHESTKRLARFSLRDVLYGGLGEPGRVSPHFVNEFTRFSQLDTAEVNRIVNLVGNVIPHRLNAPQLNAYNHLLNGGAPQRSQLSKGGRFARYGVKSTNRGAVLVVLDLSLMAFVVSLLHFDSAQLLLVKVLLHIPQRRL